MLVIFTKFFLTCVGFYWVQPFRNCLKFFGSHYASLLHTNISEAMLQSLTWWLARLESSKIVLPRFYRKYIEHIKIKSLISQFSLWIGVKKFISICVCILLHNFGLFPCLRYFIDTVREVVSGFCESHWFCFH